MFDAVGIKQARILIMIVNSRRVNVGSELTSGLSLIAFPFADPF